MECCLKTKTNNDLTWLEDNGKYVYTISEFNDVPEYAGLINNNKIPVILINNGSFYKAYVCTNEQDYNRLTKSQDRRTRIIYTVEKEKLKKSVNLPDLIQ